MLLNSHLKWDSEAKDVLGLLLLYIPNSELEEINESLLYVLLYQSINSFCDMKSYYHKLTSIFLDLKSFDSQNHI